MRYGSESECVLDEHSVGQLALNTGPTIKKSTSTLDSKTDRYCSGFKYRTLACSSILNGDASENDERNTMGKTSKDKRVRRSLSLSLLMNGLQWHTTD